MFLPRKKEDTTNEDHDPFDDEWYCAKLKDDRIEHDPEDTLYCSERKKDEDDKEDFPDGENWE